jgi:hypothetical protein
MTDPTDADPKSKSVQLAQRALEMKRAAAKGGGADAAAGRRQSLTDAAHRSASKSKPAMKK